MLLTIPKRCTIFCIMLLISSTVYSQVGIGTTNPAQSAILDIDSDNSGVLIPRVALVAKDIQDPITAPTVETGLLVFNTAISGTAPNNVTPGFYYWNGSQWTPLSSTAVSEPPIDSVSLSNDVVVNSTTYTNISGMTLTFTARKTSALINLTASGSGNDSSISVVYLRVRNETNNTIVGGTMQKIQNYTSIQSGAGSGTYTTPNWSASFSKLMTGLVVGTTYTFTVQGRATSILGTNGARIQPITNPDSSHLTLSVIQ